MNKLRSLIKAIIFSATFCLSWSYDKFVAVLRPYDPQGMVSVIMFVSDYDDLSALHKK